MRENTDQKNPEYGHFSRSNSHISKLYRAKSRKVHVVRYHFKTESRNKERDEYFLNLPKNLVPYLEKFSQTSFPHGNQLYSRQMWCGQITEQILIQMT